MNVFSKLVALKSSKKNPAPEIKTAVEAHKMDKPVKGDVNINDSVPATGNWFKPLGSADFSFQISRNPADDIINPALEKAVITVMRRINSSRGIPWLALAKSSIGHWALYLMRPKFLMKYGEQLAARTRPWDRDNQDDRYVFRGLQPIDRFGDAWLAGQPMWMMFDALDYFIMLAAYEEEPTVEQDNAVVNAACEKVTAKTGLKPFQALLIQISA